MSEQNLSRRYFKPILKQAGLDESIRLYDIRHSAASLLLAAGLPVTVVSERLGHASTKLTLDVYAHTLLGQQLEATRRMDELLGS